MIRSKPRAGKAISALSLMLLLSSCGGDQSASTDLVGSPGNTPPRTDTSCALSSRAAWAADQLDQWYLFPETLPGFVDPAAFSTLSDYVDALTATARAQGRDRYFTHVASIAEEDAYYSSGETAGLGVRLEIDDAARRLFVSEAFEGAPALAAGLDRGTEILAIGASAGSLRTVSSIMASEGGYGLYDALGPGATGVTRALRIRDGAGERVVSVTKAVYDIEPVSPRYGTRIIEDEGRKIGYLNLRTFIYSAEPQMRAAFATFKAQGVDELIVDLRYNGGGLLSVAQTMGSLMGGARFASDIFSYISYRPGKSSEDESYAFLSEASAIAPRKIAFIGAEGTASASELVINAMRAYLHADVALIGTDSYGKPVGQIAIDRAGCDDRLRIIAFSVTNADREGDYFDGLAPLMEASCQAGDDIDKALGDPAEESMARALDYLNGRSCTPIGGTTVSAQALRVGDASPQVTRNLRPLVPDRPTQPQRDMPGLF